KRTVICVDSVRKELNMRMSSLLRAPISRFAVCLVTVTGSGFVALGDEELCPFSATVSQAWKRAGAVPGWMSRDQDGGLGFRQGPGQGKPGEWPAFRFLQWEAGRVKTLPAPDQPFALDLRSSGVSDADLKELAPLKQLRALNLDREYVTDAGLK